MPGSWCSSYFHFIDLGVTATPDFFRLDVVVLIAVSGFGGRLGA